MCGKLTRRQMLRDASMGFGTLALSAMLKAEEPKPHFTPRAKNVIFCYMSGGVSHIDSFDPKPRLAKEAGKPMPFAVERTMFNDNGNIMPSPWEFHRYGQCGLEVSDLFPHMGGIADDIAVIRSMTVKFMEHAQANFYFHSGQPFTGFPSVGAWTTYGLGSESKNLPSFVVLGTGEIPLGGINIWGNGFLPNIHQPSIIYPERREPLQDITPKEPDQGQRRKLNFLQSMDRGFLAGTGNDSRIEAAIANYETAYRMQSTVPELVD
ncbi:MAG: DUF1501 domain-containing protein, partial [Bryobacterales bacterium]|nr:DUF1501 domain-containing protein [Bryobacterales bacterium]